MEKYVLIDESFQQQVLKELAEIKNILGKNNTSNPVDDNTTELMDMVDVQKYLKCCRRTILKYRKNGLHSIKKQNGRIYFWKPEIDKYFERPENSE
jgi:DNA-directed RNA polymerase specialized sigma54-like protein